MKSNKIFVVAAVVFIVGLVMLTVGFAISDFNLLSLDNINYVEKTYTSTGEISKLSIEDINIEVRIEKTDDSRFTVDYSDSDRYVYDVKEEGGVLSIVKRRIGDWRKFLFTFSFKSPTLNIYVPSTFTGDISLDANNGEAYISGVGVSSLSVSLNNSEIILSDVSSNGDITIRTDNGEISVKNTVTGGKLDIEDNNSDVTVKNVKAIALSVVSDNGEIELSNLVADTVYIKNHNDDITLNKVDVSEKLECHTHNGNIEGSLEGAQKDFSYDCSTDNGECNLPRSMEAGDKRIIISTNNGDIDIHFTK